MNWYDMICYVRIVQEKKHYNKPLYMCQIGKMNVVSSACRSRTEIKGGR